MKETINISDFDYPLPDERIARFPAAERNASKLLVWRDGTENTNSSTGVGRSTHRDCDHDCAGQTEESLISKTTSGTVSETARTTNPESVSPTAHETICAANSKTLSPTNSGTVRATDSGTICATISGTAAPTTSEAAHGMFSKIISETVFGNIGSVIPTGSLLILNNTRVVRARLFMHKPEPATIGTTDVPAVGKTMDKCSRAGTAKFSGASRAVTAKGAIAATVSSGISEGTPGARIEILCLEPREPADYERAFAAKGSCEWSCMVGNLKKWKSGPLEISFIHNGVQHKLSAWRIGSAGHPTPVNPPLSNADPDLLAADRQCTICHQTEDNGQATIDRHLAADRPTTGNQQTTADRQATVGEGVPNDVGVRFEWDADMTFGELLEILGRMPIPPYLGRDSEDIDNTRYQTVYSQFEGSVAAPTAGLHFTPELIAELSAFETHSSDNNGFPVKSETKQCSRKICDGSLSATLHTVNDRTDPGRNEAGSCFPRKIEIDEVTLHVGAGTFLPVKVENALEHPMHTEHFEVTLATLEHLIEKHGKVIAVGTTSVRTLESLVALGYRIRQSGRMPSGKAQATGMHNGSATTGLTRLEKTQPGSHEKKQPGSPEIERPIGQFELNDIPAEFCGREALQILADYLRAHGLYRLKASTRIMITPGFTFRIVSGIITNFHQPKSTLLLLIAAFTGGDGWRQIYDYALAHDFRFLSYGDSSLLLR